MKEVPVDETIREIWKKYPLRIYGLKFHEKKRYRPPSLRSVLCALLIRLGAAAAESSTDRFWQSFTAYKVRLALTEGSLWQSG